jgi:phosphatidylinositol kinase/protein kinase (PI-3  family)
MIFDYFLLFLYLQLQVIRYIIINLKFSYLINEWTGLIGWVPNCDTLNEIINEYRSSQSPPVLPKVELKVIDYLSNNNYYSMKPIQRQEIFNALMKKFVCSESWYD